MQMAAALVECPAVEVLFLWHGGRPLCFPLGMQECQAMADQHIEAKWPTHRIFSVSSVMLTAVGFIGLWLSKQIRDFQGVSEREFMATAVGSIAVWLFAACFLVGLLVLFPIALYLQRRAGAPLPGPTLPSWIAWPATAIAVLVIALAALLLTAGIIPWLINR